MSDTRNTALTTDLNLFTSLPSEINLLILSYVIDGQRWPECEKDLLSLMLVSKYFNEITNNNKIWFQLWDKRDHFIQEINYSSHSFFYRGNFGHEAPPFQYNKNKYDESTDYKTKWRGQTGFVLSE